MFEARSGILRSETCLAGSGIIFLESKGQFKKKGTGRPQVITPPIPQQQDNRRGMRRDPADGKSNRKK